MALALNLAVLGLVGQKSSMSGAATAPVTGPGHTVVLLPQPEHVATAPTPTPAARVPTVASATAAAGVTPTDDARAVMPTTSAFEEAALAASRDTHASMNTSAGAAANANASVDSDVDVDADATLARLHAPALALVHTSGPVAPTYFYAYAEVDHAAEPERDWNIDLAALDAFGLERLVFEVFVSDTGRVVGCHVLAPTGLPEDSRHAFEQRLLETRLTPALRAGQAVASRRRIEMLVLTTPTSAMLANITAASLRPPDAQ